MTTWALWLAPPGEPDEGRRLVTVNDPDQVVCAPYGAVVKKYARGVPFTGVPSSETVYPWHCVMLVERVG